MSRFAYCRALGRLGELDLFVKGGGGLLVSGESR